MTGMGSFAMGDGFGLVPIDQVFCHILGLEQMGCGTDRGSFAQGGWSSGK